MWLGIMLGILMGILFTALLLIEEKYFIAFTIIAIYTILGSLIGIYVDNITYTKYINSYTAKKETIERSITNNNLSDLEKIELVKQIVELNGELAEKKIEYNQKLLYFYLDNSKINGLEEIKFVEE